MPLVGVAHSTIRAAVSSVCPAGRALPGSWDRTRGRPGGPPGRPGCTFLGVFNNSPIRDKTFFRFFCILGQNSPGQIISAGQNFPNSEPVFAKTGQIGDFGAPRAPNPPQSTAFRYDFPGFFPKLAKMAIFGGFLVVHSLFARIAKIGDFGPPEGVPGGSPGTPSGCLLYTSPSPRDKRQSRMPSSA